MRRFSWVSIRPPELDTLILDRRGGMEQEDSWPATNAAPEVTRWLQHAREGDPVAQAKLLEHFRNYLLLIANGDMDPRLKSKLGASDVVQRSLLNANRCFEQFQGESPEELRAWLRTILKNDLRKEQRFFSADKRNAHREIKLQDESTLARSLEDAQRTPSSEAMAREKSRALQTALEGLTPEQRMVIRLRNFERLGFAEIGEELGKSPEAARKFWARSIEALKSVLQGEAPGLFPDTSAGAES